MHPLENHVKNKSLIPTDSPVVIALSGGVDSMVLFHVLLKLKHQLIVAHVNHQKRSESSDEMAAIKALCNTHNIPCETLVLDPIDDGNFQHIAREKRRAFFLSVAKKYNSRTVAMAHHLNDQAETLLMRFIKGYRLESLSAMRERATDDGVDVVRPFLDVEKDRLITYAHSRDLLYFDDASNDEDDYTRNRIRNTLMPILRKENPNILKTLQKYTQRFQALEELLAERTEAYISRHHGTYDIKAFLRETDLVRHDVIKTLIEPHKPNPSTAIIDALIDVLKSDDPNITYPLNDTHHVVKAYDAFSIARIESSSAICVRIDKEGTYDLGRHGTYRVTHEKTDHNHTNCMAICYNDKVFPLYFRTRRNGDRIRLASGTKKLKSVFIDRKVPQADRDAALLLANREEVLWIPLLKMSATFPKETHKTLYVYEV